jgi:prepilin-type N-terminal cleavage/methylation domain-containing protein
MPETPSISAVPPIAFSAPQRGGEPRGFTLVELLVVVAIIAVLLSLMVPALERAMYQAELVVCAAQLNLAAKGVASYAADHQRRFPHRAATDAGGGISNYHPTDLARPFGQRQTADPLGYDDRPRLRPYLPINALLDPLAPGKVDLDFEPQDPADKADINVHASYALWFGWTWNTPESRPKMKLGDFIGYQGYGDFPIVLGDWFATPGFTALNTSHSDSNNIMNPLKRENEPWNNATESQTALHTLAWWWDSTFNAALGMWDLNYAFDDGSVRRSPNVFRNPFGPRSGTRMGRLPSFYGGGTTWVAVPNS